MDSKKIVRNLIGLKLTVRFDSGRRQHADLRGELESSHQMESKTSNVRVQLIGKEYQQPITTAASQLREWFYKRTLPWTDGGVRVAPSSQYMTLMDEFAELNKRFEHAVNELLDSYDQIKADCKRRMNGAYREELFPNIYDLQTSYASELSPIQIAVPDDFRVNGLEDAVQADIKTKAWDIIGQNVQTGVDDLTSTISELLADAKDRISRAERGEKVRFGTLQAKAKACVERIKTLNVTDDPVLTKAAERIEASLTKLDADKIKSERGLRDKVVREADAIKSDLTGDAVRDVPDTPAQPAPAATKPEPKVEAGSEDKDLVEAI